MKKSYSFLLIAIIAALAAVAAAFLAGKDWNAEIEDPDNQDHTDKSEDHAEK